MGIKNVSVLNLGKIWCSTDLIWCCCFPSKELQKAPNLKRGAKLKKGRTKFKLIWTALGLVRSSSPEVFL